MRWGLHFIVLTVATAFVARAAAYPVPTTDTQVDPVVLAAGATTTIEVEVRGALEALDERLPISVSLILDVSGSMTTNNRFRTMIDGALQILALLDPQKDFVTITAFGDGATTLPLSQNKAAAEQRIRSLRPTGSQTNLAAGVEQGLAQLQTAPTNSRLAILLTDGQPTPNAVGQEQRIRNQLQMLAGSHISLYTIGIEVDVSLLEDMADWGGGQYVKNATVAVVADTMLNAFRLETAVAVVRDVLITESLNPRLEIVEGTLRTTQLPNSIIDAAAYQADLSNREQGLAATGRADLPLIPVLNDGPYFEFKFEVMVRECDPDTDVTENVHTRDAVIQFVNGNPNQAPVPLERSEITILRCGVYLDKSWDPVARVVTLSLRNASGSPLRELFIVDRLDRAFLPDVMRPDAFVPAPSRTGALEWEAQELANLEELVLAYPVAETMFALQGAHPIEVRDGAVATWLSEVPFLLVLEIDHANFDRLRQELASGAILSAATLQQIGQRLRVTISSGQAVPVAPSLQGRFDYALEVPRSDLSTAFVPSPPVPVGGKEELTGRIYVDQTERGLQLFAETSTERLLPVVFTAADYVPGL